MSSTNLAAHAATSPLFAAFLGVGTTPFRPLNPEDAPPAPLHPKPWQHVLVVLQPGDTDYGNRVAQYGTVTCAGDTFFRVLLRGEKKEKVVTDTGRAQWDSADKSGTLPMWFFTQQPGEPDGSAMARLEAVSYDLFLHNGDYVPECFFKVNRFLQIGGAHHQIALADVVALKPSL